MAKIIIDNQEVHCRDGINVLQAALEAGWDVPHLCYHPALKVVASCRLCMMEMKTPDPRTKEMVWPGKLIPSCQTPARDGIEVRFDTELVAANRRRCMELWLLDHPLDCPVCDQAGECSLQDYTKKFGNAQSRMVDEKYVNPKKDIGPRTFLYQDRCVLCTRCVRFTQDISGTGELCIVNRGSRSEIDVFPGRPLDNPLQGNVVDLCPVGNLLDKDFLFKQRVWFLSSTPSVCTGCATGCSIRIDHNDNVLYRLKPRYNPKVNDYWICDHGRFGWKHMYDKARLTSPFVGAGDGRTAPLWEELPGIVRSHFEGFVKDHSSKKVVAVLSPFMACEEAWLLIRFIRDVAPKAALTIGPVPEEGSDVSFPAGAEGEEVKFTISKEKCPNRRGIEILIKEAGGTTLTFDELVGRRAGEFSAGWMVGGYPGEWVDQRIEKLAKSFALLVVQDMFDSALAGLATVLLPSCAWAEREGCFVNTAGLVQPFERALTPPEGMRQDGQYLFEIAGFEGLYSARRVREMMAESISVFREVWEAPLRPAHAH